MPLNSANHNSKQCLVDCRTKEYINKNFWRTQTSALNALHSLLVGQKIPHSLAMLILELPTLKIDIFNVQKLYLVFENNGTGPNHFIFNIIYEIRGLSIGFLAGTIRRTIQRLHLFTIGLIIDYINRINLQSHFRYQLSYSI